MTANLFNHKRLSSQLKDATADDLVAGILGFDYPGVQGLKSVTRSYVIANFSHSGVLRQNPVIGSNGKIHDEPHPYILHPLRNTVRILRWGVTDPVIVSAALLHDTIEDEPTKVIEACANFVANDTGNPASPIACETTLTEAEARECAAEGLIEVLGPDAARIVNIVLAVTNPISQTGSTKTERHATYVEHVSDSLANNDSSVFLVKLSDVVDNAMSIHHSPASSRKYFAGRYRPLCNIFDRELARHSGSLLDAGVVSVEGLANVKERVARLTPYLEKFL